jgi:MOSC domain-containing protein YiiM
MRAVPEARAIAGAGLEGDRYAVGAGTFSGGGSAGRALTLIETEAIAELAAAGIEIEPIDTRRNLIVSGIDLDALIGRRFRVGEVICRGARRCEPCAHLQRLTEPGTLRGLVHRGGLRADLISGGTIRRGDEIEALDA